MSSHKSLSSHWSLRPEVESLLHTKIRLGTWSCFNGCCGFQVPKHTVPSHAWSSPMEHIFGQDRFLCVIGPSLSYLQWMMAQADHLWWAAGPTSAYRQPLSSVHTMVSISHTYCSSFYSLSFSLYCSISHIIVQSVDLDIDHHHTTHLSCTACLFAPSCYYACSFFLCHHFVG